MHILRKGFVLVVVLSAALALRAQTGIQNLTLGGALNQVATSATFTINGTLISAAGGTVDLRLGTVLFDAGNLSAGMVPLGRLSGLTTTQLSATAGILNTQLANSLVTIGTTPISLGGTSTTLAGLTNVTSATFTGALAGNAATTTALLTARTINGTSFDGTANITVTAAAGTLTGTTLASNVTASSLVSAAGGSFGTAAYTNATAYEVPLTFSTGLTRSTNTVTVNTTQNIAKLSNLTGNGPVYTSGSDGTLNTGGTSGSGTTYALTNSPVFTTPTLGAALATSINGNVFTTGSSTYTGTGGQTYTFPTTSAAVARTDAANTFAGTQTFSNAISYGGVTLSAAVTGTGGMVLATSPTLVTPTLGAASLTSGAITGTGGAGFVSYVAQSSTPSAPASGFLTYADSSGRMSWRRASDTFTRTWDATLTANRVYTLPDAASSFPVYGQTITYSGPTAARTVTYPDANFTAARNDAAQTFTGVQTFSSSPISSTGLYTATVTGTGGTSYEMSGNQVIIRGVTLNTAGSPSDIATVTLPSGWTRYTVGAGNAGMIVFRTVGSGTAVAATLGLFDQAAGAGTGLVSPAALGNINNVSLVQKISGATGGGSFGTSGTLYVRQTVDSANSGTVDITIPLIRL